MGSPSQTRNATYRWPASKSTMASVRTPDGSPRRGSYWMKPVAIAAPFHSSSPITPSITGGIAVRTATISFEFDVGTVVCAPAAAVQIRNAMAANPSRLRTAPYLTPIRYFKIFCSLNEVFRLGDHHLHVRADVAGWPQMQKDADSGGVIP